MLLSGKQILFFFCLKLLPALFVAVLFVGTVFVINEMIHDIIKAYNERKK